MDVSSIEELKVVIAKLAVACDEPLHVVQLTQSCREIDMSLVA
jgi:hypothetical protein